VLLAAIAFSVSLVLGASAPLFAQTDSTRSQLPATQPGLSRNEGVFLVTAADDGRSLIYFIAQNTRHSTLPGDLQREQQLNPLWPVRTATRDEVLAFPEAAPIGSARTGLLMSRVAASSRHLSPSTCQAEHLSWPAPVVAEAQCRRSTCCRRSARRGAAPVVARHLLSQHQFAEAPVAQPAASTRASTC
jgi:hypothetical protein